MKINSTKFIFAIVALISFQISNSQIEHKKFDKNLKSKAKKSVLPGFSLTILKNDSIYFQNRFDFANKSAKKKYTIKTIQPIGSISKTSIGFSIMKSVDLGSFTLETDSNTILPFKIYNPN